MKIGLFADPHYSDKTTPSSNRCHALSYDKINDAMIYFKNEKVDLVICLGDLTDDCIDVSDNPKALGKLSRMIDSFGIKFYSLMGNHDCLSFTNEEFDILTNGAYPPFKIEADTSTLIFLDANYLDNGEKYKKGDIDWTNTFLPNEQIKALKQELKSDKNKYVFVHQNIDNTVEENHIIHNADKIRELLENASNVKMVIQGHYHNGKDSEINGIKYHTLRAMCEGVDNYYEIIEI